MITSYNYPPHHRRRPPTPPPQPAHHKNHINHKNHSSDNFEECGEMGAGGLIPEGVFSVTAITTNNTATIHSKMCSFFFRHLKPRLFFGYTMLPYNGFMINMAEPEKALLDYLYLNKPDTPDAISELRINKTIAKELIDNDKMENYLALFKSSAIKRRHAQLKEAIND